jgi:hypothetical protein
MFLFGWVGIGFQQWTGNVSIPLLIVYGCAIGFPGVAALLSAISGLTGQPQSPSAPGALPTSSTSSSTP